jgi:uncharacterized RDD family membrane protein YckC
MLCPLCGYLNGEDDHRCLGCGRLMPYTAMAAPASYLGVATPPSSPTAAGPDPFTEILRQATDRLKPEETLPAAKPEKSGAALVRKWLASLAAFWTRRASATAAIRSVPAPDTLAIGHVAHPMRRLTAALIDVVMVLLGFGVFAGTASIGGSAFGDGKVLWITAAATLLLLSSFYGLIWAVAMCETAGMRWMQMKLVTFDGSPVVGHDRAVRFVSAWLSYCSGGLGLMWVLADEEGLAFHDLASNTYPAAKEPDLTDDDSVRPLAQLIAMRPK